MDKLHAFASGGALALSSSPEAGTMYIYDHNKLRLHSSDITAIMSNYGFFIVIA